MNDKIWKDGKFDVDAAGEQAIDIAQMYLARRGNYDEIDSPADSIITCYDGSTMCDVMVTVNAQDDDAPLGEIIDAEYKGLVRYWLQCYAYDNKNVERVRADHMMVKFFKDADNRARLQHVVAIVFGEVDPESRHVTWLENMED